MRFDNSGTGLFLEIRANNFLEVVKGQSFPWDYQENIPQGSSPSLTKNSYRVYFREDGVECDGVKRWTTVNVITEGNVGEGPMGHVKAILMELKNDLSSHGINDTCLLELVN